MDLLATITTQISTKNNNINKTNKNKQNKNKIKNKNKKPPRKRLFVVAHKILEYELLHVIKLCFSLLHGYIYIVHVMIN